MATKLVRKLFDLQREKDSLQRKLALEEDNLRDNLRKRLKDLQQEKVDTENMLE